MTLAAKSGTYTIGGELKVNRLGFGAMRITGPGVFGEPANRGEALAVLNRTVELGINFIDTADSYGPRVSETLIRESLHPFRGITVATKGGLMRPKAGVWIPNGHPSYLRRCVEDSLMRLGLEQLDLWQLHRIDPQVREEDQFGVIAEMQSQGLIRLIGLSQVNIAQIERARKAFPVATVQNLYNLSDRSSEDVLDYCEKQGIGFIPWYPLANAHLTKTNSPLAEIARKYHATPAQIALSWLLKRSPVVLPIPGTCNVAHLDQNTAAATIALGEEDFATLSAMREFGSA